MHLTVWEGLAVFFVLFFVYSIYMQSMFICSKSEYYVYADSHDCHSQGPL